MPEHELSHEEMRQTGPIRLPLELQKSGKTFADLFLLEGREAYHVLRFSDRPELSPMIRIESACTFAHLYGSALCDCKRQLDMSLQILSRHGHGLLIYALDQHGRGIGLRDHVRVYDAEQSNGLDTVEAHSSLDLPTDARNHDEIAAIIKRFGIQDVRLLSNNPQRISDLQETGLTVTRVPLEAPIDFFNVGELSVKKEKLGHLYSFNTDLDKVHKLREWIKGQEHAEPSGAFMIERNSDELCRGIEPLDATIVRIKDLPRMANTNGAWYNVYLLLASELDSNSLESLQDLNANERTRLVVTGVHKDLWNQHCGIGTKRIGLGWRIL